MSSTPPSSPPPPRRPIPEILAWHTEDSTADQIVHTRAEAARRRMADLSSGPTGFNLPLMSSIEITLDKSVDRAGIPIVPTLYPGELSGTITVHNH
jgi:hypothetical protein